jgi:HD-GYP domain-containing protein (c-di-GMP phosphodiesterase class II)
VEAWRLADLLVGLSRLADLGFGLESGTAVRSCALASRLARTMGLPTDDIRSAYYTALLHHVGCVGYAHETARLFGDELAANTAAGRTDAGSPSALFATFLPTLTAGRAPLERARLAMTAVVRGAGWANAFTMAACEVGRDSARRLQLPEDVQNSLFHVYDMWRGRSPASRLTGDRIPVGARIARLTGIAALFESIGGTALAVQAVRHRAGGMLDPNLADCFADNAAIWFGELDESDARTVVLDAEPDPHLTVPELRLVAEVFGDLADLKSPYLLGHSRAVAALGRGAAERLRLPADTQADLDVAGLLHDVGRVATSNAVWDKPGRLSTDEWEQVRLHPYQSERILAGSTQLARLAPLVGRHHERLDGTGYHRGSTGADLSLASRVLAAADAYRTRTEHRPHRDAMPAERAAQSLLDDVRQGTLDADAVQAVLGTAGHPVPQSRRSLSHGLSEREVEVLGLIAHGHSNAQIAQQLVISRRTAEHHVQHIYTKIGVSSRAAATLFAIEHQLLEVDR